MFSFLALRTGDGVLLRGNLKRGSLEGSEYMDTVQVEIEKRAPLGTINQGIVKPVGIMVSFQVISIILNLSY